MDTRICKNYDRSSIGENDSKASVKSSRNERETQNSVKCKKRIIGRSKLMT